MLPRSSLLKLTRFRSLWQKQSLQLSGDLRFQLTTIGPELDRSGLSENMPQHHGQPGDGDESDRNNHQIKAPHSLLIFLCPTKLLLNC
jgi:hypothetical protein